MTNLIAYHHLTQDLALFESEGDYWIGSYNPHLAHQNGEPRYSLIDGYYSTADAGLKRLAELRGDEI